MSKLIFLWMLMTGVVTPMDETNDERDMYVLCIETEDNETFCFEHAYEEEIIQYIETGTFRYDDFLLTNKNK